MPAHVYRHHPRAQQAATRSRRTRWRSAVPLVVLALALVGCGGDGDGDGGAFAPAVVQPLALPGPYTVACSNVAQDFSRVASGGEAKDYWEGRPAANGTPRYAADLLTDPANTLAVTVDAPSNTNLYGSLAGKSVGFVVLVCYPTRANNPRPNFALPTGQSVPHMQTGADAPLFIDDTARYPVLAFSHGFAGSPLSEDHFVVLAWLASYGYVVAAPFHGDPRIAALQINDFGDAVKLLANLSDVVAMQALRPLAVSATLDLLMSHPQWRDHIDSTQIGGFGASMGGETMMLLAGAALTTSPGLASSAVGADARIKAAVGYVPYFGQPLLPSFGRDQEGLSGLRLPFLAISGTADTTAPLPLVRQGVDRLAGPRQLVTLGGVQHGFDDASAGDILTWSLTFLDAQVRGLPSARAQSSAMTEVAGGGNDTLVLRAE